MKERGKISLDMPLTQFYRYYNNIATLKELYKLRHNTLLEEVDLRLNPVTKNEPDYRLFMVHMLPNLRKLGKEILRYKCT